MKIIVCDDIAEERNSLCYDIEKYLGDINCEAELLIYEKSETLAGELSSFKHNEVRIAFLDIYMPGLNGIEVAKKIRETDNDMVIIFTTSSPYHGLDGYSVKAFQYLVKPVHYTKLKETLDDCIEIFADSLRYIEVIADKVPVRIPMKDIIYIEIMAHYGLIYTPAGIIKSRFTLDEMEKQLAGDAFLRTHRSFIVNMRYVKRVTDTDFLMKIGGPVPIRRTDKVKIKQSYMDFVFSRTRGE